MAYEFTSEDAKLMNTPEQRVAALNVVRSFVDTASLPELAAMLGLGERS